MIRDDPKRDRRRSIEQWVGWIGLALLLTAACVGLLGSGWLSHAEARSTDGALRVRYQRFGRLEAPSTLDIEVAAGGPSVDLRLPRSYVEAVEIEGVSPPPGPSAMDDGDWRLRFDARDGPAFVRIQFRFRKMGALRGRVALGSGSAAEFDQFVYP